MTEQEKQNIIEMLRDVYNKIDEAQNKIDRVKESMTTDLWKLEAIQEGELLAAVNAVDDIRSYFDITGEELWGEEDE